jgi:hypothetical protein
MTDTPRDGRGTIPRLVATPDRPTPDPALAKALEERNALWAQAVHAKALERELQEGRELLQLRETSRSWRVTAPLRRVGERLQALRR